MKIHSDLCLCRTCISKLADSENRKGKVDLFIEALEKEELFTSFEVLKTTKGLKSL